MAVEHGCSFSERNLHPLLLPIHFNGTKVDKPVHTKNEVITLEGMVLDRMLKIIGRHRPTAPLLNKPSDHRWLYALDDESAVTVSGVADPPHAD